jgi:hypothetical protein
MCAGSIVAFLASIAVTPAFAQGASDAGVGEANLKLPDLSQVDFLGIKATSCCCGESYSAFSGWFSV